jgi:outer membrane protein
MLSRRLRILFVLPSLLAAPLHAETLLDVYELALKSDPVLKSAEATFKAGQEARVQGRSQLLPQITTSAGYGENDLKQNSQFSFFRNELDLDTDGEQQDYSVNLTQNLFDLSAWFNFKQGKTLSRQAEAQFAADQQDLIIRTVEAYVLVLRALDNLKSSRAEEAAYSRQLEQTQQRFEVGLIAITDVHEARAAYDLAVVNRLTDEGNLGVAYEGLAVLTGQSHSNLWLLSEEFPVVPPAPATREEWVDMALQGNFTLKAAGYAADSAQMASNSRRAEHLPKITGNLSWQDSEEDQDVHDNAATVASLADYPTFQYQQGPSFRINFNMPLYAGGYISSQRREYYERYIAARETHTSVMRNIIQLTRSLHVSVVTDVERVKARKQSIVSAQSALDATQAGYEVGTRNVVDVLNAQQILYRAIRDYANTRFDYVQNMLRLRQQSGMLSPADIEMLNKWLIEPPAATSKGAT